MLQCARGAPLASGEVLFERSHFKEIVMISIALPKRLLTVIISALMLGVAGLLIASDYPTIWFTCGFLPSFEVGEIIGFQPDIASEKNPHNPAELEYHVGDRAIIRLSSSREARGEVERAPATRKIGDRVRVCHDRGHPDQVYIVD